MSAALIAEQRAHGRAGTMLSAEIGAGRSTWAATIRNLSVGGALIQCDSLAEGCSRVVLSRGPLRAAGKVLWRGTDTLVIQFDEPINLADWLESKVASSTGSTEKEVAIYDCRHTKNLPTEIIVTRVREEMAFVSRLVEGVAKLLSEDPILRVRHAKRIQELRVSEQMLNELTAVLEHGCSADAVLANVTDPMRQRLLR